MNLLCHYIKRVYTKFRAVSGTLKLHLSNINSETGILGKKFFLNFCSFHKI